MNNMGSQGWLCHSYHNDLKMRLCFQLCDHWRWSFEQTNNSLLFISWSFGWSFQLKSFQSETLCIGHLSRWREDKSPLPSYILKQTWCLSVWAVPRKFFQSLPIPWTSIKMERRQKSIAILYIKANMVSVCVGSA